MASAPWSLSSWGEEAGLTEATIVHLQEQDFTDEDSILEITREDVERMNITPGQKKKLTKVISSEQIRAIKKSAPQLYDWAKVHALSDDTIKVLYDKGILELDQLTSVTKDVISQTWLDWGQQQKLLTVISAEQILALKKSAPQVYDWAKVHALSDDTIKVLYDNGILGLDQLMSVTKDWISQAGLDWGQQHKLLIVIIDWQKPIINEKYPELAAWAKKHRLSDESVKVLYDNKYTDKAGLCELTRGKIAKLQLTEGQKTAVLSAARRDSYLKENPESELSSAEIDKKIEDEDVEFFMDAVKKRRDQQNMPKHINFCSEHDTTHNIYNPGEMERIMDEIKQCSGSGICCHFNTLSHHKKRNILFYCNVRDAKELLAFLKEPKYAQFCEQIINHKDQNGDTPFLYHCRKGEWQTANIFFKNDLTNKDAADKSGFTALLHLAHYRGKVNEEYKDFVLELLSRDALLTSSNINHECVLHLASSYYDKETMNMQHNETIIELVCKSHKELLFCKDKCDLMPIARAANKKIEQLLRDYHMDLNEEIGFENDIQLQEDVFQDRHQLLSNMKDFRNDSLMDLLKKEGVGLIDQTAPEFKQVKADIHLLVKCLKAGTQIIDEHMAFDWEQMGSVKEETKIALPNEFDILMSFIILAKYLEIKSIEGTDLVHLFAKNDSQLPKDLLSLFDENKCERKRKLKVNLLFQRHYANLQNLMSIPELWQVCSKLYKAVNRDITADKDEITNLTVLHHGEKYPLLEISVDLVPAIMLADSTFMENEDDLYERAKDRMYVDEMRQKYIDEFKKRKLIVAKKFGYIKAHDTLFRLTKSQEEADMMQKMGDMRKIYKICKIARQPVYCEENKECGSVENTITSYMLKNTVMYLYAEDRFKGVDIRSDNKAIECALMVYKELEENLKKEKIPMFFLPKQNILYMNMLKSSKECEPVDLHCANKKPHPFKKYKKVYDNMMEYCTNIKKKIELECKQTPEHVSASYG